MKVFCMQWYDRVLTPKEIEESKRCPWADFPRPIAHVNFDDVTGATDISGNGFNVSTSGVVETSLDDYPKKAYQLSTAASFIKFTQSALANVVHQKRSFSVFFHLTCTSGPCVVSLKSGSSIVWTFELFATGNVHKFTAYCSDGTPSTHSQTMKLSNSKSYFFGISFLQPERSLYFFIEQKWIKGSIPYMCAFSSVPSPEIVATGFVGKLACIKLYNHNLTPREVSMISACPMTVADSHKAVAVYSGLGSYICSSNLLNLVGPQTKASLNNVAGFSTGASPFWTSSPVSVVCNDGTSRYWTTAIDSSIAPSGAFTMMVWVYIWTMRDHGRIFHLHPANNYGIEINLYQNPGRIAGAAYCDNGTNIGVLYSTNAPYEIITNKWYHISYSVDPINGKKKLVLDGTIVNEETFTPCTLRTVNQMSLGALPHQVANSAHACFDGIRVFKEYLSNEQIAAVKDGSPLPVQVEPLQCNADLTATMPDSDVLSSTSFTEAGYTYATPFARGLLGGFSGSNGCCWRPDPSDAAPYLMFDFGRVIRATGITTVGTSDPSILNGTVTKYNVQYGVKCRNTAASNWIDYKWFMTSNSRGMTAGQPRTFVAGRNPLFPSYNPLRPNIDTQYIRIVPTDWVDRPVMRVKIHGCNVPSCGYDLLSGLSDTKFSSSTAASGYEAIRGYIGNKDTGYWKAERFDMMASDFNPSEAYQYWQVDFSEQKKITRVRSQGTSAGWVTNYYFKFGDDGQVWTGHTGPDGFLKLLPGNTDATTIVQHNMGPYLARYVRFYPMAYETAMAARFGVSGCESMF